MAIWLVSCLKEECDSLLANFMTLPLCQSRVIFRTIPTIQLQSYYDSLEAVLVVESMTAEKIRE